MCPVLCSTPAVKGRLEHDHGDVGDSGDTEAEPYRPDQYLLNMIHLGEQ